MCDRCYSRGSLRVFAVDGIDGRSIGVEDAIFISWLNFAKRLVQC